jgi:hypothetical protein
MPGAPPRARPSRFRRSRLETSWKRAVFSFSGRATRLRPTLFDRRAPLAGRGSRPLSPWPQAAASAALAPRVAKSGRRTLVFANGYHYSAMRHHAGAIASAGAQVAGVRDDPAARLALLARLFHGPMGRAPRHLPFRRAALSFMRWQVRRGVLNPLDASPPGSVWWRAVNERLLRDGCETVALPVAWPAIPHRRLCGSGWSSARDRRGATGTERTTRASWPDTWSTETSPKQRAHRSASS